MWATIGTLATLLIPTILQLILYIINKNKDNDKVRNAIIKALVSFEIDFPTSANDEYQDQLRRIKERIDGQQPKN